MKRATSPSSIFHTVIWKTTRMEEHSGEESQISWENLIESKEKEFG